MRSLSISALFALGLAAMLTAAHNGIPGTTPPFAAPPATTDSRAASTTPNSPRATSRDRRLARRSAHPPARPPAHPHTALAPDPSASPNTTPRTRTRTPPSPSLASRIAAIIDRPPFDRAHWGILVRDPVADTTLYARDAERRFIPASNLKLVVAAAAAHYLEPDYRYRTTLYATGPVRAGVVEGDVALYGRGDPTISGRYAPTMTGVLEALADSLEARGVRRIAGGIIADESHWEPAATHGDWETYDALWWYAAPVGALGFNDNSIDFHIAPGRVGAPARITWEPETSFFVFVNRATTVRAGREATWDFDRVPGTDTIFAYGRIPADAGAETEYFAVAEPARYTGTVFREVLERAGIAVDRDAVRVIRDPARSPAAAGAGSPAVLVEYRSPRLPQIIDPILMRSQNWFAGQLLKTLGRELEGEGSWEAGLEVEERFLTDVVGIDAHAFRLRDASGLSAGNLITPRALVELLAFVRTMPNGSLVLDALPVAATEPGSLRYRLRDLRGRVRAKTGSIRNVASLSGYARTRSGRELVFSIVVNGATASGSRVNAAIDDVVRAIAAQ